MASLSLSVLSTTRMMNCRVGGKNHTDWPLFKKTFTAVKCDTAGGHFRAKGLTMGIGDCFANKPCLNARDSDPVWQKTKGTLMVVWGRRHLNQTTQEKVSTARVIQHDCDPNHSRGSTRVWHCLTLEWMSDVTIVTAGLLQYMVSIVTLGLLITLLWQIFSASLP